MTIRKGLAGICEDGVVDQMVRPWRSVASTAISWACRRALRAGPYASLGAVDASKAVGDKLDFMGLRRCPASRQQRRRGRAPRRPPCARRARVKKSRTTKGSQRSRRVPLHHSRHAAEPYHQFHDGFAASSTATSCAPIAARKSLQ